MREYLSDTCFTTFFQIHVFRKTRQIFGNKYQQAPKQLTEILILVASELYTHCCFYSVHSSLNLEDDGLTAVATCQIKTYLASIS